jgi:hypothetical protein
MYSRQGSKYEKPSRDGKSGYYLGYEKTPPIRLLALDIIFSYWVCWVSQTHGLSKAMNMILEANSTGRMDFDEYQKTENEKQS